MLILVFSLICLAVAVPVGLNAGLWAALGAFLGLFLLWYHDGDKQQTTHRSR